MKKNKLLLLYISRSSGPDFKLASRRAASHLSSDHLEMNMVADMVTDMVTHVDELIYMEAKKSPPYFAIVDCQGNLALRSAQLHQDRCQGQSRRSSEEPSFARPGCQPLHVGKPC